MLDRHAFDRSRTLADYGLMDSGREPVFDTIVAHAAEIAAVPIAEIALIDERRVWLKARVGAAHDGSDSSQSICARVVQGSVMVIVPDATRDERFRRLAPVVGDPGIRFYAGMPLRLRNGVQVGTLCVIDVEPRDGLDEESRQALELLARRTVAAIEMRQRTRVRHAFQGQLGSMRALLLDEARTALVTASAALEQADDLLALALLDEVISLVDGSIDGVRADVATT